ncbi:MAG: glycosyltransferase family 4 protein, partial [Planctomycetota bacterium]|nr:glycosyltransferase family 4 protein [Planctomycetota bacterium]
AVFCFRAVREFARRFGPRLIHAQSAFAVSLAEPLAGDLGVPCVVTCHHILKPGRVVFPPLCARLIAVSQVIRENLVNDIKIPKDRIRLIPIGIDTSRFRRHVPRESGDPVVAAVGSLTKRKAFEYFIEAARILADSDVKAGFLLAGEGPEERRLRRLASRLGLDRCLTFYTHPIDSAAVLAEADVVVHPSLQEGSGIGVLEALAAGVPVVAAGVGGVYDVLKDGETGYIVPAGDARAIAEKVGVLLRDGQLRARMGEAGRALVERDFTVNRMAADTVEVYTEAVKEPASGG